MSDSFFSSTSMPRAAVVRTLVGVIALTMGFFVPAGGIQAQCLPQEQAQLLGDGNCGQSGCRFGYGVALSTDGNTALIGAYGENANIGAAYVYIRSGPGGTTWTQQGPALVPTGGQGATQNFGYSVALSSDGNTAIIGAYGDNNSIGAAYIFVRSNGTWSQQGAKLVPTGGVGAVQYCGFSVSISADGNTAIIGAEGDNGYLGAAYIFTRDGAPAVWTQRARLLATGGLSLVQYFGSAVSISGDGNTAAVGAYGDNNYLGAAYLFARSGNNWPQQGPKFIATNGVGSPQYFGCAISLSYDGNAALVGAYGDSDFEGAAYIINRYGTIWLQQQKFLPVGHTGAGHYGTSVSLSPLGTTALVGAPQDNNYVGAAYVCAGAGNNWAQIGPRILPTGATGASTFGQSVCIGAGSSALTIGGFTDNNAVGAAYIYSRAVSIVQQPASALACLSGSAGPTFSVTAAGNGTITYQWQIETSPDVWTVLTSTPLALPCGGFAFCSQPTSNQTIIGVDPCLGQTGYQVRCIVTNGCGSVTSDPATLAYCPADFNCSGAVNTQDIFDFLSAWFAGEPRADFNGFEGLTVQDIFDFLAAWFAGCS